VHNRVETEFYLQIKLDRSQIDCISPDETDTGPGVGVSLRLRLHTPAGGGGISSTCMDGRW